MKTNFNLFIFIFTISTNIFLVKAENKGRTIIEFKEGTSLEFNATEFNEAHSGEMNSKINEDKSITIEFETNILDFNLFFYNIFGEQIEDIISIKFFDLKISRIENMSYMFYYMISLQNIEGLENFDTSQVKNMANMFSYCASLTSINISNFITSSVTDMSSMFFFCVSLTSINISNFITSSVTDMSSMFYLCLSLESIDVSNFDTSSVISMNYMFISVLNEINVCNFKTSSVTTMEGMFGISEDIIENVEKEFGIKIPISKSQKIIGLSNFDTSSVTNMKLMFYGNIYLESIDLSNLIHPK